MKDWTNGCHVNDFSLAIGSNPVIGMSSVPLRLQDKILLLS